AIAVPERVRRIRIRELEGISAGRRVEELWRCCEWSSCSDSNREARKRQMRDRLLPVKALDAAGGLHFVEREPSERAVDVDDRVERAGDFCIRGIKLEVHARVATSGVSRLSVTENIVARRDVE